jgi:uncharacterized protein YgbK (DUF1537 family)
VPLILGCIADDLTGATDLANTLVKQGMKTTLTIGLPSDGLIDLGGVSAVVIALKSRTTVTADAVRLSLEALELLRKGGARQILFKYCSTFDSTDKGNIGPVSEALLGALGSNFTVACPAFPTAGRTIYNGHLFAGDVLLSDSSMRDHPLTPMTDSNLVSILSRQSQKDIGLVPFPTVDAGPNAIRTAFANLRARGIRQAIVDAITDRHLMIIGEAVADMPLVTGGSGIALGLPDNFFRAGILRPETPYTALPAAHGMAAVLAGSCSQATSAQVAHMSERRPALKIDPIEAASDREYVTARTLDWARQRMKDGPILIYATASPDAVHDAQQKLGLAKAGEAIEHVMADVARGLVAAGVGRLVIAGGETSGAVIQALGIKRLQIGAEIDPGVPWTMSIDEPRLHLALKSGNFGTPNFFLKALDQLEQ